MTSRELKLKLKNLMLEYAQSNEFELPAMIDALQVLLEASSIAAITVTASGVQEDAVLKFEKVLTVMQKAFSHENIMQDVH